MAEQGSLNASILGPGVTPDAPEFSLFVDEVVPEMSTKSGQKCTAIRRVLAPEMLLGPKPEALSARLAGAVAADPGNEATRPGMLVSLASKADAPSRVAEIGSEAQLIHGNPTEAGGPKSALLSPLLFHCADPDGARRVHETEPFGPDSILLAYLDIDHAAALANRVRGSLVAPVIPRVAGVARQLVTSCAAWHGHLYSRNRDSMAEATGHGAPLPRIHHRGPGRADAAKNLTAFAACFTTCNAPPIRAAPTS